MSKYTTKRYELEAITSACEQAERQASDMDEQAKEYKKRAIEECPDKTEDTYYFREAKDYEDKAKGYRDAAERIYGLIK